MNIVYSLVTGVEVLETTHELDQAICLLEYKCS